MSLPETICIGYQDIEVVRTTMPDDISGAYDGPKSQIYVRKKLTRREELNTVLHECLHAIFYIYGIKPFVEDDEAEEKLVFAIGNGLTEVFTRNPDLTKWVAKNAAK